MAVENKAQVIGLVSGSASIFGVIHKITQDGKLPQTILATEIVNRACKTRRKYYIENIVR